MNTFNISRSEVSQPLFSMKLSRRVMHLKIKSSLFILLSFVSKGSARDYFSFVLIFVYLVYYTTYRDSVILELKMPPKRKLISGPSSVSKMAKSEETVTTCQSDNSKALDISTIKAIEETIKKQMYDQFSYTQTQTMKVLASFQQQKFKLERSLVNAENLFKKYENEIKIKDETIKTLKQENESLKSQEIEGREEIITMKEKVKSLQIQVSEKEFRANQLEDNYESLHEEVESLKEEKQSRDEDFSALKATSDTLLSDKNKLLLENEHLLVEIKKLKDNQITEDLKTCKVQCEQLRTELKKQSLKTQEKETSLAKCKRDFQRIVALINEFLEIKDKKEKEFMSFYARHSDLSRKYHEEQKSKVEELTKMNKKLDEAQKSNTVKQSLIDKFTLQSEESTQKMTRLEEKICMSIEKEKEAKKLESRFLKLQMESREERKKVQSLEDKLKEREQKIMDLSKKLQKKRDLIKKIEKKSQERKMKLKRYWDEKLRNDNSKVDKKKIPSVREASPTLVGGKFDYLSRAEDELLIASDDEHEKEHHDVDKYLQPLDVNPSCDEVNDTIEIDSDNNLDFCDADTYLNLNETDELLKIREFIENTEKDVKPAAGSDCSMDSPEIARPAELQQFYWRVRESVRGQILRYFQQDRPGDTLAISD